MLSFRTLIYYTDLPPQLIILKKLPLIFHCFYNMTNHFFFFFSRSKIRKKTSSFSLLSTEGWSLRGVRINPLFST